jgi:LysM repeat protein
MNKSTIILVSLLLILGAVTYFLLPSQKEHETSYEPTDINLKVDSASVVKVEIHQKTKSVTIENVGGKWMLTSPLHYAADATTIKQLLSGLAKFKVGSLISSNPEKQNIFQVDSSGTNISVTDRSGRSVSMIVGKMGPSFSEVYFRLPTSKDVYLGEGLDTWTINKDVKEWRDKSIVSTPSESVKGLTYTVADKEIRIQRDTSGWKSGEKTLDPGTMTSALNQISNLHADDFIDTLMKIATHPIAVGIQGAEDVTLNLYPSAPDSAKYFVQLSNSPQLFVISKWTAQQILKPVEESAFPAKPRPALAAKKEPAVSAPPQAVEDEKPPIPIPAGRPAVVKKSPETARSEPPPLGAKKQAVEPLKQDTPAVAKRTGAPARPAPSPGAKTETTPAVSPKASSTGSTAEEEGELTVHTVKRGETMTTIAKQYSVSVEQILKWNLLKSISVKPGQELYIYVKK